MRSNYFAGLPLTWLQHVCTAMWIHFFAKILWCWERVSTVQTLVKHFPKILNRLVVAIHVWYISHWGGRWCKRFISYACLIHLHVISLYCLLEEANVSSESSQLLLEFSLRACDWPEEVITGENSQYLRREMYFNWKTSESWFDDITITADHTEGADLNQVRQIHVGTFFLWSGSVIFTKPTITYQDVPWP